MHVTTQAPRKKTFYIAVYERCSIHTICSHTYLDDICPSFIYCLSHMRQTVHVNTVSHACMHEYTDPPYCRGFWYQHTKRNTSIPHAPIFLSHCMMFILHVSIYLLCLVGREREREIYGKQRCCITL